MRKLPPIIGSLFWSWRLFQEQRTIAMHSWSELLLLITWSGESFLTSKLAEDNEHL